MDTQAFVGKTFEWSGAPGLTFEVRSVVLDPQIVIAGRKLRPYMNVQWSDTADETMLSIADFKVGLKSGLITSK